MRPNKLGKHLEAFADRLPALKMFRLCFRFGGGPLSKIPAEIEVLIEELFLEDRCCHNVNSNWEWDLSFMCFESRCEPVYHMSECSSLLDEIELCIVCEAGILGSPECLELCKHSKAEPCDACKSPNGEDCEASCAARVTERENEICQEEGSWYEFHDSDTALWRSKIQTGPNGGFEKLAKVRTRPVWHSQPLAYVTCKGFASAVWARRGVRHDAHASCR